MNHPWTHIFWTLTTIGHEPSLDTYFFGYELPLDIYYLDMDHCRTYLIMLNMNHEP